MSKFKVTPKPTVNEQALENFSAGADQYAGKSQPAATVAEKPEKPTETFLLRLTPTQMTLLNLVYERTNVKSKQKLVESILMPALEEMAKNLAS
jgi:hypothetical protein